MEKEKNSSSNLLSIYLLIVGTLWIPTLLFAQPYNSVRFLDNNKAHEEIMPSIFESAQKSVHGTYGPDNNLDSVRSCLNTWYYTNLFDRISYATGFTYLPDGGTSEEEIWIWELHFRKERDAVRALQRLDNWSLKEVAFFPPANWFWVYFRGRIIFMGSIGMTPLEDAYKNILSVILNEIHNARIHGLISK